MIPLYKPIVASQNFFFRNMAMDVFEQEGIMAIAMGIDSPFFNMVLSTELAPAALTCIIPQVTAFFAKHAMPWTWVVFPFSEPQDLGASLLLHRMAVIDDFAVMGMDVTQPLPEISHKALCIKEVLCAKDFDNWDIPEREGFGGTEERMKQFRKQTETIPYGEGTSFRHYVLYENNVPIAASTISYYQGNARLDNIAVCPAYQNRGFGTAITQYMLKEAQRSGAEYCFLDASKQGAGMYKKLGFQEYYTGQVYGFPSDYFA